MSDGLSAVYKFETRIGEGKASQDTSSLYVGLSGGFGTVSMGKLPGAGDVHVGFVDNSGFLGGEADLLGFTYGSSVSYASPSIGGFSFQVDAQGDRSGAQDKDVDSAQFGATLQLGESGKVGVAYIDRATKGKDNPVAKKAAGLYRSSKDATTEVNATSDPAYRKGDKCALGAEAANANCEYSAAVAADGTAHIDDDKTAMIAGQYRIGGMALHLGYGQRKWDTDSKAGAWQAAVVSGDDKRHRGYDGGLAGGDLLDKKQKTTFFGMAGGIGDTGVSFFLQVKNTKTDSNKVTHSYQDKVTASGYEIAADGEATKDGSAVGTDAEIRAAVDAGLERVGTSDAVFRPVGRRINTAGTGLADVDPAADAPKAAEDRARGSEKSSEKNTPFTVGVSRSLGGGASIHLEHDNTDDDASHNQTALILKVDF